MESESPYRLVPGSPPIPREDDFNVVEPLAYMQRGLSASYEFSDYVYVVDEAKSSVSSKKEKCLISNI